MTEYRCVLEIQTNGPQLPSFTNLLVRVLGAPLQMLEDQAVINTYRVDVEEVVSLKPSNFARK